VSGCAGNAKASNMEPKIGSLRVEETINNKQNVRMHMWFSSNNMWLKLRFTQIDKSLIIDAHPIKIRKLFSIPI